MEDKTPYNRTKQEEGGIGPIIGTLIIVILLIVTALYIWSEHLSTTEQIQQENRNIGTSTTIIIYSTSTVPADIEKDLKASPTLQNTGF